MCHQHLDVAGLAVVHQFVSAGVSLAQHLHLTLQVHVLLAGSLAIGHSLIDLIAGVDNRLHILLTQILLGELGYLLVGRQLTAGKDGLRESGHGIEQQFAGVDDDTGIIGPSGRAAECDAGIEGRTGSRCIVESLLHGVVGHTDVRTALQHHGGHTYRKLRGQRGK